MKEKWTYVCPDCGTSYEYAPPTSRQITRGLYCRACGSLNIERELPSGRLIKADADETDPRNRRLIHRNPSKLPHYTAKVKVTGKEVEVVDYGERYEGGRTPRYWSRTGEDFGVMHGYDAEELDLPPVALLTDWIDARVIAELLLEDLKGREMETPFDTATIVACAEGLWLAALEGLYDLVRSVPDERIAREAKDRLERCSHGFYSHHNCSDHGQPSDPASDPTLF